MGHRCQTLNERQIECISTCMGTCKNVAYPTLGLIEEVGEYTKKILKHAVWNEDAPSFIVDTTAAKLLQIADLCAEIGEINKKMRHGTFPALFSLSSNADLIGIEKELGDVEWNENVAAFEISNLRLSSRDQYIPTAQRIADINHEKLLNRVKHDEVDGKGDDERTPI